MANQTVSVNRNMDDAAINGLANGEDVTIDTGAILTINSDSRWGQQAAVVGNITINTASGGECLIDGTEVWWIPYDAGTGNVPALGTVDTDDVTGSIAGTGEFLGIFSAYGVAPTAAAAAVPATGFLKLRRKTADFADNEVITLAGGATVTVNSSTGGKRGWLHIVGEEGQTITVPRLGALNINGDWFELDATCSGARNQTIQLPVADQYPGVWIETGNGTGVYEFYPNVGAQMTTTNFPSTTTDGRSKVVFISATGLLRIGSTTTPTNAAYLPTSGAKIRIPNIIISSSTSADWAANLVSATLATRWDITTTSAGAVNINYVSGAGFNVNLNQAYSLTITHSTFLEDLRFSEIPTEVILTDCHVGLPATNIATVGSPITVITCFAGATITDCVFVRATVAASTVNGSFTDIDGFVFDNVMFRAASPKSGNTPTALGLTRAANCDFTDSIIGDGRILITTCQNLIFTNTSYWDRTGTTTTTSNPVSIFDLTTGSINIKIDGISIFGGLANVHPYTGLVSIANNCQNIKLRNVGTPASPFNCGSANATGVAMTISGLNSNIRAQRVYLTNTRTSFATFVNSDNIILLESCWCDAADTTTLGANNMTAKGCRWTNSVTGQTAVYGTHWSDIWTSTTAGRIVLQMNEKTALEPSASSYSIISGNPKFTSTGNLILATSGDEIVFLMPYYAQGITSFLPATATQPTFTGTNPNNHDIYYKIDKNNGSGFNASWRNLAYKRAGGGGSSGTTTVTMTSTTGVNVDDYVFGTGIGTNAKVVSIDSATNITVSVNNSGTVSGVLVFNQLPAETGITAANGVKLQIRIVANTTASTNVVTYLRIDTVTTSSDQNAVAYPLDVVNLTVTGLQTGSDVVIYEAGTSTILDSVDANGTSSWIYEYEAADTIDIGVFKAGYVPYYVRGLAIGLEDSSVPIAQVVDRAYLL